MFFKRQIIVAVIIGLLALGIRLAFLIIYIPEPMAGGDPTAFWTFAQGIARGDGFRSTFEPWLADRPPLYPYFLAGIFLLFGESKAVVFLIQALFGALSASLFYLCAYRLLDEWGSLVAGVLFACWPHFLFFTQQILTEAIYIPLWIFLLTSLLVPVPGNNRVRKMVLTGLLLGLLAMVRREAILPGGLIILLTIIMDKEGGWKTRIIRFGTVIIVTALVLLPWLVRNGHLLGKPVLSSSGGINFMVGNNPLARGGYTPPPVEWQAQFQGLEELARDKKAWELSLEWIRENPTDFVWLLPQKVVLLWGPANNWILDGADLTLIPLYLLGLVRLFKRRQAWKSIALVSLLPAFIISLIAIVFLGMWRYRLIVYPGLLLLAGYGAMTFSSFAGSLWQRVSKRKNALA